MTNNPSLRTSPLVQSHTRAKTVPPAQMKAALLAQQRQILPIDEKKEDILQAIRNDDVLIITAETGAGKSTRVPQYLAEAGYTVIITQPRILAAMSLADRVAEEMGVELGTKV
jgi:HrpA-like RNA helicase